MLVVKRRIGQALLIGEHMTVRVAAIVAGGGVMLEVDGRGAHRVQRIEKAGPPKMRRWLIKDDMGNETSYDAVTQEDAWAKFAKDWPYTIKEVK